MALNYSKLIADTVTTLPQDKQVEVYDFAKYLRAKNRPKKVKKSTSKHSILSLCGMGKSDITDGALNHDKYLYG